MFMFEKGATLTRGSVQCTEYIPKWHDGVSSQDFVRYERRLMDRINVMTATNMPRIPTDVTFKVYYPAAVGDTICGTLVFKITHPAVGEPLVVFTIDAAPMNRARLDFVVRNAFVELLNTAGEPMEQAQQEVTKAIKVHVA